MGDNRAHSELGASISHRWISCPGSVALSRGLEQTDNVHAQAGRAAHTVAEQCLRYNSDADRFLGDLIYVAPDVTVEVDDDMVYGAQMFVDYCRSLITVPFAGDWYWVEQAFTLESIHPPADVPMFGTADFVIYDPVAKQLEVVDLKFGQGVVVEVKGNPQLRYYALGAALLHGNDFEIETVKITVVQPRAGHPDGFIRSETIPYIELLEFAGDLLKAAEATQAPDAPLNPGSHCRFCPALAICPAQREQAQALAQVAFSEMPVAQPPMPETLPDEILDDMASKLPILDDWSSAVKREVERRLLAGRELQHHKLIEKRPTRKWVDVEKAMHFLKTEKQMFDEEIFKEPELKSPAQIEKLVGKKNLPADLVEKKSSGYKLAPASDPHPALAAGPQHAFPALPPASE